MEKQFDFEHYKKQAVEDLLSGKKQIDGPDGVLAPLLKQFLEAALDAEVKSHVKSSKGLGEANRRNGRMRKEVRSMIWRRHEIELAHLSLRLWRSVRCFWVNPWSARGC